MNKKDINKKRSRQQAIKKYEEIPKKKGKNELDLCLTIVLLWFGKNKEERTKS